MSNGFVYGEFINLDKVLYYLWNISRTFANFLVVWLVLYHIITEHVIQTFNSSNLIKYITKMIGAIILINISWFGIGAVIDISTILTSTASSLSSSYIASDNNGLRDTMRLSMERNHTKYRQTINLGNKLCSTDKITDLNYKNEDANTPLSDIDELLDKILPNENSISWPLLYLGIGVLQLQDYLHNSNNPNAIIDNLFVISMRLAITLLFTISLILLIVVNIFRLVAIRFAVAFWPILIILLINKQEKLLWDISEKFSPSTIGKAIFAPVVATGLMSIGLIVIVMMQWFLQFNNNIRRWDTYINASAQGSRIGVDNIFDTTLAGDILGPNTGDLIKNTFTNILLIVFTLFILYGITTILSSFLSKGFGWKTIESISNLSKSALGAIRIPSPAWGTISLWAAKTYANNKISSFTNRLNPNNSEEMTAVQNRMRDMIWLERQLYPNDYKELTKLTQLFNQKKWLSWDDYTTLKRHAKDLISKWSYQKRNISISNMQGIPWALEGFLRNLSTNETGLWIFGSNITNNKLQSWKEWDTVEQFIQTNYQANKNFFNMIYEDLGGDASSIQSNNGKGFWDQAIRWKKEE